MTPKQQADELAMKCAVEIFNSDYRFADDIAAIITRALALEELYAFMQDARLLLMDNASLEFRLSKLEHLKAALAAYDAKKGATK